jgi:hypothetical protein
VETKGACAFAGTTKNSMRIPVEKINLFIRFTIINCSLSFFEAVGQRLNGGTSNPLNS